MRLPFVSRAMLDLAEERAAKWESLWAASMSREEAWARRYETLVEKIADRQIPIAPELPERTRDEVIDAIIARSGTNGQLRAHLSAWAMNQRRAHVPDAQIIRGIVVWESPDEDGTS